MKSGKPSIIINCRFLTQRTTGVQRYAIELSLRLKKLMPETIFVCPRNILPANETLAKELNVKAIGLGNGHFWEQIELVYWLKVNCKNALLINFCNTGPLLFCNNVVTIHDLAFLEYPQWFSYGFRIFYKFLIPKLAQRSARILTVSYFSKTEIIKKLNIDPERIDVIYNSVDKRFKPTQYPQDSIYALFVGSMDPRKNMQRIIDSLPFFPKGIKLKIIGGGSKSFGRLKSRFEHDDRIEWLGYLSEAELIGCYSNALCLIYPSLYEGFGLPPLEAQALGIPIIVSDISVFREVFQDSGVYCNPLDKMSISNCVDGILNLSEIERKNLVSKGILNAKRFSWDFSAHRVCEIIKGI